MIHYIVIYFDFDYIMFNKGSFHCFVLINLQNYSFFLSFIYLKNLLVTF